jgi:hypothetical protein
MFGKLTQQTAHRRYEQFVEFFQIGSHCKLLSMLQVALFLYICCKATGNGCNSFFSKKLAYEIA